MYCAYTCCVLCAVPYTYPTHPDTPTSSPTSTFYPTYTFRTLTHALHPHPLTPGKILDAVVHADTSEFNTVVVAYLLLSVTSGAFGGLRSLLFNIVGRRLSNTIRVQLYKGIVIQGGWIGALGCR